MSGNNSCRETSSTRKAFEFSSSRTRIGSHFPTRETATNRRVMFTLARVEGGHQNYQSAAAAQHACPTKRRPLLHHVRYAARVQDQEHARVHQGYHLTRTV